MNGTSNGGSILKPFEGFLGNNVELRVIEFLLPFHGVEFNITDLAKEAGVSRTTADRVVKKFVEWNFMKISRTENTIKFYQINENSPIYNIFIDFDNKILELMLSDEELYDIHEGMENQGVFQEKPKAPKPIPASIPTSIDSIFYRQNYGQMRSTFDENIEIMYQHDNQPNCNLENGGRDNAAN